MNAKLLLLSLFVFVLWTSIEAACGPQLTTVIDLDAESAPKIIKKLTVDSIYPFTVEIGDTFQIVISGTDAGEAYLVAGDKESTLSIGKNPTTSPSNLVSSSPQNGFAPLSLMAASLLFVALGHSSIKGPNALFLVVVFCASMNFISTASNSQCDNVKVKIVIPSGKVQNVCDSSNGKCICGPDYSGEYCNFYKSKCIPTAQQMANRFNYDDAFIPADIPLPAPGESFCDNNFGSEIWRVTNREPETNPILIRDWVGPDNNKTTDQRVALLGFSGFSPGNKYLLGTSFLDGIYVYEINIDEYEVPHINPTKRKFLSYAHETDSSFFNYVTIGINQGAWLTEKHYVFVYFDKVFAVDVSLERNSRDGMNVTFIGDLAPFLENNYYPEKLTGITRCTASRRFADGSIRILCDIAYAVGTLSQPDYTKVDSHHPNATCINAQWFENAGGRIGYIAFDVLSATPKDPSKNLRLYSRFVNGLDSDEWYCFQSTLQWSGRLNATKLWVVYNGLNNGYKPSIDRSGQWINNAACDRPDILGWSPPYFNPVHKLKVRPFSEGGGVIKSIVHGFDGHGAMGWEESMVQSFAPLPCGTCIGYWKNSEIPDEDPDFYTGTNSIGLMFNGPDGTPWRYSLGLYGTYFHATSESNGEAVMQGGCDASVPDFDCSTIPRAAEVFRITPDDKGSGTIERIASTRNAAYALYNIMTSECEPAPEPCWAVFQSTWGEVRYTWAGFVPSDLFIVRFR